MENKKSKPLVEGTDASQATDDGGAHGFDGREGVDEVPLEINRDPNAAVAPTKHREQLIRECGLPHGVAAVN